MFRMNKKTAMRYARPLPLFVLWAAYSLIVNLPSFIKRVCPVVPVVGAFSLAPIGVPLIDSDPTVVVAPFSLLTRT